MYQYIDPDVAAHHRELVNRHWDEMKHLRTSTRRTRLGNTEQPRDAAHKGAKNMNAKRMSIAVIASAIVALMLAPGLVGAEPRFDVNRTGGNAHYQMNKKELIVLPDRDVILDYETMKFLEENTLGYHEADAEFAQLDSADKILAITSVCQGEGLVNDPAARAGVAGTVATYCSGEGFAESLGGRTDDEAPSIPLHPDWPDGFNEYDTPQEKPEPRTIPLNPEW